MNKLGFALFLFAIGIGIVGTLIETQVMLHRVYALASCPDGTVRGVDNKCISQGPMLL